MKCKYCGATVDPGSFYCPICGREIWNVPDYNPLNDVLEAQIKGGVDYATRVENADRQMRSDYPPKQQDTPHSIPQSAGDYTRQISPEELDVRRQAVLQRRRERLRKKRQQRRILILCIVVLFALLSFIIYNLSYTGIVNSGHNALKKNNYTKAETKFKKAISKKASKTKAYEGLAEVYLAQDNKETAETMYLNALKKQSDNAALYKSFMEFYLSSKQQDKISPFIDGIVSKDILKELNPYVVHTPSYGLEEEKYDDVQQLKLESAGNTIYYTTDGNDATVSSTKYTEPIQIGVGETTVSAIAVNKKGIPSLAAKKTYTVELPIAGAPSVTPSTGQYDSQMKIEIMVPDGYQAYYTTDDTTPTSASTLYSGAIDMPSGNTIFCAVLIDKDGRVTEVTKRNYELTGE